MIEDTNEVRKLKSSSLRDYPKIHGRKMHNTSTKQVCVFLEMEIH